MRSPRRVTLAPMGIPARRRKDAMDLRARVTMGCWPVMARRSRTATVDGLGIGRGLADAHVHDNLLDLRDHHDVLVLELVLELLTHLVLVLGLQARDIFLFSHVHSFGVLSTGPGLWKRSRLRVVLVPPAEPCALASRGTTNHRQEPAIRVGMIRAWRSNCQRNFANPAQPAEIHNSTQVKLPQGFFNIRPRGNTISQRLKSR